MNLDRIAFNIISAPIVNSFRDFVFAHTSSKFLMPEVQWSLIPISGGTQTFVNKIKDLYVKEILLFSEEINADKALKIGLVNGIFEDYSELLNHVLIAF